MNEVVEGWSIRLLLMLCGEVRRMICLRATGGCGSLILEVKSQIRGDTCAPVTEGTDRAKRQTPSLGRI